MKIGFSFGRCIRDIVKGVVKIEDVLCVIARTHVTREQLGWLVDEYSYEPTYLAGLDRAECVRVAEELMDRGLIHQPRTQGSYRSMVPGNFVWMDVVPTSNDAMDHPSVQEAWETYQTVLRLAINGQLPDASQAPKN